jgi:hypothetical protein
MKQKNLFMVGVLVLALTFGFTLTACGGGGGDGGGGGGGKALKITNITSTQLNSASVGYLIGVFPQGTTLEEAVDDALVYMTKKGSFEKIVAGASDDDGKISPDPYNGGSPPYTLTTPLKDRNGNFNDNWSGTGTFDIYFIGDGGPSYSAYLKKNVQISSGTTTIDADTFEDLLK